MPRTDLQDLMYSANQQGQSALGNLTGMHSSFDGISNAGDVRSRFGIKPVAEDFAPFYKTLESTRAKNMRNNVMRVGRSASPGMTFSNTEGDYLQGLTGLMGQEGQADINQQNTVAGLLQNIMGSKDQFNLQKTGLQGSLANGLFRNYLGQAEFDRQGEGPTGFDIFNTIFGQGAKVATAAAGAPKTTNYNF